MSHRLLSRDPHNYLSPRVVLNRLKSEFAYVESDGEEGRRYVMAVISQLQANRWTRFAEAPREYLEQLDRGKNRALYVCFGDNPSSEIAILTTYVVPGIPLYFEYSSHAHEQATEQLLARCAAVLHYEIFKDRRIILDPAYTGTDRRRFLDRRSLEDRRRTV